MAGGGVKPGFAYGATDEFGYHAAENRMHIHDFHATVLALLGLDHTEADVSLLRPRFPADGYGGQRSRRHLRLNHAQLWSLGRAAESDTPSRSSWRAPVMPSSRRRAR